jgi:hypothetical protein
MEVGKNGNDGMHAIEAQANSISAQQVVKAAHDELLQLMRQRADVMKRIGTVKQTIAGLANLFGDQWTSTRIHQSVPQSVDGCAASAGRSRGLHRIGTLRSDDSSAAQRSSGVGHDCAESPGGLR